MTTNFSTLMRLGYSTHILADMDEDIRGRTVVDSDGNEIGKVSSCGG